MEILKPKGYTYKGWTVGDEVKCFTDNGLEIGTKIVGFVENKKNFLIAIEALLNDNCINYSLVEPKEISLIKKYIKPCCRFCKNSYTTINYSNEVNKLTSKLYCGFLKHYLYEASKTVCDYFELEEELKTQVTGRLKDKRMKQYNFRKTE